MVCDSVVAGEVSWWFDRTPATLRNLWASPLSVTASCACPPGNDSCSRNVWRKRWYQNVPSSKVRTWTEKEFFKNI